MPTQYILVEPFDRLAEVQELDLLAVLGDGVVDEFVDLLGLDPVVRMKNEAIDS